MKNRNYVKKRKFERNYGFLGSNQAQNAQNNGDNLGQSQNRKSKAFLQ